MKKYFVKAGYFLGFILTNVISAAAIEAARTYHLFVLQYYALAFLLWAIYAVYWYRKLKRKNYRLENESVFRHWLRSCIYYSEDNR
jgi:hypothetical protein